PREDFNELSRNVVAYCGGLPLALEVLGSYLIERTKKEWGSVLSKLQIIPDDQVQEKLRISFDNLRNHMEKDIFLDVCCFFIGKDRAYVTEILNGCGLHADIGITVLIERSLIKVEKNNKLGMHDLIRDMGREIIRENATKEPGRRSRLWFQEDVIDVLTKNTGTEAIEGLALKSHFTSRDFFETCAFDEMKRLRLLKLDHVQLSGDYGYLSKQLRWICWQGFPSKYIPSNFNMQNVIAIDLKHSNLRILWKEPQVLRWLKILNLSHSKYLTETPDFSKLPSLEKLILKDCPSLCKSNLGDLAPMLSSLSNLRSVLVQCGTEFQLSKQVRTILDVYGVNFTELEITSYTSQISKHYLKSYLIGIGSYEEVFNTLSDCISERLETGESSDVFLPGDNDPYWLAHMGEGHSVYFTVPENCHIKGMTLCVVYISTPEIMATECLTGVLIVNYTKCTIQIHKRDTVISFNDVDWQAIISHLGHGDKVEIFVTFGHRLMVKETVLYLMCDETIDMEMKPSPEQEKEAKKNAFVKLLKNIVHLRWKQLYYVEIVLVNLGGSTEYDPVWGGVVTNVQGTFETKVDKVGLRNRDPGKGSASRLGVECSVRANAAWIDLEVSLLTRSQNSWPRSLRLRAFYSLREGDEGAPDLATWSCPSLLIQSVSLGTSHADSRWFPCPIVAYSP
ncbi:TMV resistance protein N, partial [Mucuna pruriens]